jgi:AraC-like DNA-binding protein
MRYAELARQMGAPVDSLLAASGIPVELFDHPAAAVCLKSAYKFGESACRAAGTEHLGLYIGMNTSLDDLGPVGEHLKRSTTVYDYLQRGIRLYSMFNSGQRIWLSDHGEEVRLNMATVGHDGVGPYQSQLETLSVTVMALRRALGPYWSPDKIGLAFRSKEAFPENSCFEEACILKGVQTSYMAIPRSALGVRFPYIRRQEQQLPECIETHRLTGDLTDLVQLQIEELLCEESLHIDMVAESLVMSRRSLQRSLAEQGTSYSELLADIRAHQALDRLQFSEETIADIAFDLGYTDASNFTRAFRLRNGVSPQQFRHDQDASQSSI